MTTSASARGGVLDGLRVVDLGQYLAGPMVTMFLADFGADVIRVDPPAGPRWDHPANAVLQRGKRSVRLDLASADGRDRLERLVTSADVVVDNFRPGVLRRLGIDPHRLRELRPELVWCSLPGFPADDPRADVPGWDGVIAAATGLFPARHGEVDGDPVFSTLPMASTFGAFMAAHRIVGALLGRARTGRGAQLEVSLYEAAFQAVGSYAEVPISRRTNNPAYARLHRVLQTARASDGTHLYFDTPLRGLQAFIDRFLPGPRLVELDDAGMRRLADELRALIATRTGREWERICQEELAGAFGLCQPLASWLQDEHALESGTVVEVEDPLLGTTVQPGLPVLISGGAAAGAVSVPTPDPARGPVPEWIAGGFAWAAPGVAPGAAPDDPGGLPLGGIRVLDCASLLAGPTTTRILAQYGAEVIKVDRAGLALADGDPLTDDLSAFHGHRTVSSGKRMVFLDLKRPGGRRVLDALLPTVDVVHHNFTADAAERLGLAPDRVRGLNPAAICSTMSLHSHGGFREHYRGHEPLAQMATGMGHLAGGADAPRMLGGVVNDHAAGHLSAFGIMLSLLDRRRGGIARDVNASLSRTATLHQLPFAVAGKKVRGAQLPEGPNGWHALDRLYRVADGWVYVAAPGAEARWLGGVRGLESGAAVAAGQLGGWLEEELAGWTRAEVVDAFAQGGIGAHAYVPVADLVVDPDVRGRGLISVVEHPGLGSALGLGHPVFTQDPAAERQGLAARRPGLDTLSVIEELGLADRLAEFVAEGAVAFGENPVVATTSAPGYWRSGVVDAYAGPEGLARAIEVVRDTEA